MTPKHLKSLNLLKHYEDDKGTKINELYRKALQDITHLPLAIWTDQYRWELFRDQVKPDEYNCRFWQMREEASGITPPIQRFKEDFDPPATFHIGADVEYLRFEHYIEIKIDRLTLIYFSCSFNFVLLASAT